jgi:hypothetical protein
MIIEKSRARKRRPAISLPAELHSRLRCIAQQSNYRDQVDSLSLDYPHSETTDYRWYLHHKELPYFHVMETRDHGNHMILHVFVPALRGAVTLEKHYSDWELSGVTAENELDEVIPSRFENQNLGWLLKPASDAQMRTLARQLCLPSRRLPQLTAFNAQLLLQTTIAMRHLPYLRNIIELTVKSRRSSIS